MLYRKCNRVLEFLSKKRKMYQEDDMNPIETTFEEIQTNCKINNYDQEKITSILIVDKMVVRYDMQTKGLIITEEGIKASHEKIYLKKSNEVFWKWVVRFGSISALIYGCIQVFRFLIGDLC